MKHLYLINVLFLWSLLASPSPGHAQKQQNDPQTKDKVRAAEIAYLSQKLDLTPEEAQKFWPLYNQYSREVELLIIERRANKQKVAKESLQDDKELRYEQRMLDIRSRYNKEFLKVLPPNKAGSVFRSEREFRGQLIRSLKERRGRNMGGTPARRFRQ